MKANSAKTQKAILRNELQKFISDSTPELVKESEAMALYSMYLEGYSKEDIIKIHGRFISLLNWPEIMGEKPKSRDVIKFMSDMTDISFDDVKVELEETL